MSLSNPRSQSPVRRFFKLRGIEGGAVVWYDKGAAAELEVDLPFRFIVLDVLNIIGGFHEPTGSGIYSNEFRDNNVDTIVVKSKAGVLAEGSYNDIKDRVKSVGGKFGNSVYIAYQDGGEWTLGNVNLVGAAVSEWFDFRQGKRLDLDPGVTVTRFDGPRKKGRNEYWVPVFGDWIPSSSDLSDAMDLDKSLQEYLNSRGKTEKVEEPVSQPSVQPSFGQQSFGLTGEAPF